MEKFKTALQEIAYAGKYYTSEDMIEIAQKALSTKIKMERITDEELDQMEIRLAKCKEDFGYLTGDQIVMVKAVEEIKFLRAAIDGYRTWSDN